MGKKNYLDRAIDDAIVKVLEEMVGEVVRAKIGAEQKATIEQTVVDHLEKAFERTVSDRLEETGLLPPSKGGTEVAAVPEAVKDVPPVRDSTHVWTDHELATL